MSSVAVMLSCALGLLGLDSLFRATSACLVAVTLAGLLAAVALLPRRSLLRAGALIGSAAVGAVLLFCGSFLLLPAVLAVAAGAFHARSRSSRATRAPGEPPLASKGSLPYERPMRSRGLVPCIAKCRRVLVAELLGLFGNAARCGAGPRGPGGHMARPPKP
ncbi:hypothetical protein ACFV3R_15925 [Streptomyces sp. NPDC059740]|uniref:hypothetical protein n=1 Tax=Streptomyces sp. NPDC059740 TaxID=3346926 RepID=UPI00366393B8